jgi:hypothetical protein
MLDELTIAGAAEEALLAGMDMSIFEGLLGGAVRTRGHRNDRWRRGQLNKPIIPQGSYPGEVLQPVKLPQLIPETNRLKSNIEPFAS